MAYSERGDHYVFLSVFFQREEHVDGKGARVGTEGDGSAVFGGDGGNALGAEAVVSGVAGGNGPSIFHGDGALVAVVNVDGEQLTVAADGKIDGAQVFVQLLYSIEGVFQQIAEKQSERIHRVSAGND